MELSDDSLLKPFRQMAGMPAPGADLGGWYHYDPDYDPNTVTTGFAPGCTFGQWVSALARNYAITGSRGHSVKKVLRLNRLYAKTISGDFYEKNRFPAYCYDKLVCGLIDSHQFVGDPDAFSILEQTTNTALPHLPGKAVEHGQKVASKSGGGIRLGRVLHHFRKTSFSPISAARGPLSRTRKINILMMSITIRWRMAATCSPAVTPTAMSIRCVRRCRPI